MKKTLKFICKNHNKYGFTLAETLITLVIIGVVAALTIPTLSTKYQEHVEKTQVKKTISVIYQALKKAEAENGDFDNWATNINGNGNVILIMENMRQQLKIAEYCGFDKDGCAPKKLTFYPAYTCGRISYTLADGTNIIGLQDRRCMLNEKLPNPLLPLIIVPQKSKNAYLLGVGEQCESEPCATTQIKIWELAKPIKIPK